MKNDKMKKMIQKAKLKAAEKKLADHGIATVRMKNNDLISVGLAQGNSQNTYSPNSSLDEKRNFFKSIYAPLISLAIIESKNDIQIMMNGVYGIMLEIDEKKYEVMYLPLDIQKTKDGVKDISFAQFISLIERYNRKAKNPVLVTLEKMKKVQNTTY